MRPPAEQSTQAEERIRRVFNRLGKHAKTYKSQLQWGQPDFVVTPITFNQGQFLLDEPAKQFLTKFTTDLQESAAEKLKLYIVGLASQEKSEKQQWILSTKRAETAADFIRGNLPAGSQWSIYSWGTGTGGNWVVQDSVIFGTVANFYRGSQGNPALGVVSSFSTLRHFFDLARFAIAVISISTPFMPFRHGICIIKTVKIPVWCTVIRMTAGKIKLVAILAVLVVVGGLLPV